MQTIRTLAESSGGPARTVSALAEALGRRGAQVTVLAGHDARRDGTLVTPDPDLATTRLLARNRLGNCNPAIPLAALAGVGAAPMLVHDNGLWSPFHVAVAHAARRLDLPLVISPHGMLDPWALAFHGRRKRVARALYQDRMLRTATGLQATAASEHAAIRALYAGPPVATIANGVDCPAAMPDRSQRFDAAARTVLFMSRVHPVKNLPGLVRAWQRLAGDARFAGWTLVIAGPDEGGHAGAIAAQVAQAGLQARVRIVGAVAETDKAAMFAAADVFVLPTFSENFGIVVAEALAAGVPVVTTTGAPWSCLGDSDCGWWVPPDPDSLATALAAAMLLPAIAREAMGRRGHALVQARFSWDGIAADMLGFYRWLLDDGPLPAYVDPGIRGK